MSISESHDRLVPFPDVPEPIKRSFSINELTLRRFGRHESDLNIDFEHWPRPFLITRILESCTRDEGRKPVPENFFWDLTVGKRIEGLLNLIASEGSDIEIALVCPDENCAERLQIDFSLDEVAALQEQAYVDEHLSISVDDELFVFRRPTAADQLTWLKDNFTDETALVKAMIARLAIGETDGAGFSAGIILPEHAQTIERCLDEHDPLVDFKVKVICPYCSTESTVELDLEELSIRSLRQAQLHLLASVHRLAERYHWSEQEIFSVPYWRRVHYLALLDSEQNR
jgi:hypothetical protein